MTQNPFGDGGLDLGAMLEQAQQMQARLMQAQAELATQIVSSSAGGVSVSVSGAGELTAVSILPGTFDGSDEESLTDLGDLVVAAFRDAKSKADGLAADALGPLGDALGGAGPSIPGQGG